MNIHRARRPAILILSFTALVSLGFLTLVPGLEFTHSMRHFFPQGDPETVFFDEFKATFGNDNDQMLIAIEAPGSVFDSAFLADVGQLESSLKQIPGVERVLSPLSFPRYVRRSFANRPERRSWISNPAHAAADSARIFDSGEKVADFFSADRKAILMQIQHAEEESGLDCAEFSGRVDSVLQTTDFANFHTSGKCLNQTVYVNTLAVQSLVFTSLAVLLISLILWLTFRSFAGVLIPLLIIAITVEWTIGTMLLMGESLNLISHILPVILLVISMSDVVHLRAHYLSQKPTPERRLDAFFYSVRTIGTATFFTSLTTAIGFLTLTTSSFQPVVQLGIYASLGLAIALAMTYLISGSFIVLWPSKGNLSTPSWDPLDKLLHRIYRIVETRPYRIVGVSAVLLIAGVWGSSRITVNQYILDELAADHPNQQDFRYFAGNFGGSRPFDIRISTIEDSDTLFTLAQLQEIERVSQYLMQEWGADIQLSPSEIFISANQVYHFGRDWARKLPDDQQTLDELMLGLVLDGREIEGLRWLTEDRLETRISGRIPDVGSKQYQTMESDFRAFVQDSLGQPLLQYHPTGTAHLMDLNTSLLAENILYGLAFALVFIAGLFAFQLRSWKMVLISLAVNILPLVALAGIMGWMGMYLKISTSFVFVIAFGIAVDDSIHFLSRLRQEMKVHNIHEAVKNAFFHSGKAIFLTTIVLMGGFLTFCFSDFLGTFAFGVLLSSMLLLALLADLLLLPTLIHLFYPSPSTDERADFEPTEH